MKKILGILTLFVACFGLVSIVHGNPITAVLLAGKSTSGVTAQMPTNFKTEIRPTTVQNAPVSVKTTAARKPLLIWNTIGSASQSIDSGTFYAFLSWGHNVNDTQNTRSIWTNTSSGTKAIDAQFKLVK